MFFKNKVIVFFFLFLVLFSIWYFRFKQEEIKPPKTPQKVEVVGTIATQPRILGQSQYFKVGQIWVRTGLFPEMYYGQRIKIRGILTPKLSMSFPEIERLESKSAKNKFFKAVSDIRLKLIKIVKQVLPEPQASLVSGMILGAEEMPLDFRQKLIKTGTIHTVVVSGQNVSILAGFFVFLLPILGRRKTIILTFLAILSYVFLAGLSPPTVRAGIMGFLAYGAKLAGREALALYNLFLAAFLMLFLAPNLLFDLSFQLSFAATLGILVFSPVLMRIFSKIPEILKQDVAVTLSAWLFTSPILLFSLGQISFVAPLSNLLIFWSVPILMVLGFAIVIFGVVFLPFSQVIAFFAWALGSYFVLVVEKLSQLPFSWVKV